MNDEVTRFDEVMRFDEVTRFDRRVVVRVEFQSNKVDDSSRAINGFCTKFEIGIRDSRCDLEFFVFVEEQFDVARFFASNFGNDIAVEVGNIIDVGTRGLSR